MSTSESQRRLRNATVLLVDDDSGVCRDYARVLRRAGMAVDAVTSAKQALELLSIHSYDVVVSDVAMPGMSGVDLLRAVREHSLDLPVILMTGSPSLETAMSAVDYGARQYLLKPVEPSTLAEAAWRAADMHALALLRRQAATPESGGLQLGDRAGLEQRFARAVDRLWVAFQPIVSWSAKSSLGYEALLRSDEETLPLPRHLLDAAQRLHRLHDLGRAARAKIAESVAANSGVLAFVNLHPLDLNDNQLLSSDSPLSKVAERVVLEVTERAALEEVSALSIKLAKLRNLGFRIAIDDLGAGYAGLASFSRLEPDFVKLDISLIRDVDKSDRQRTLVRGIAQICSRDLGMQVICEGVERSEERDALADDGLDLFQGYLFGRPNRGFREPTW